LALERERERWERKKNRRMEKELNKGRERNGVFGSRRYHLRSIVFFFKFSYYYWLILIS
jgi:hypothetical protein